jgi:hypothetical protein
MFLIKHFVASAIHLGHKTNQWNPRTAFFLFAASPTSGTKIHIIDLEQTILMIRRALTFIQKISQSDGFLLVSLRDLPLFSPQEPDLSPLFPKGTKKQTALPKGLHYKNSQGNSARESSCFTPDHTLGRGSAAAMCPENGAPPRGAIFLFQAGKNAGPVLIKEAMK